MKNKGFTLVELLAVIVVLAVISIITIPMIGNVIEESKKKILEQSVNGLVEVARYYSIENDGTYEFLFDENHKGETINGDSLDYRGSIDAEGKLYLDQDGNISICVYNDKYYAYKNYNSGIVIGDRSKDNCDIGYDVISNKYIAFLESEGMNNNIYSKDEVNNLIASVDSKVTTNINEITNIKSTIETLQNSLNNYALQSSLNTTNSNLDRLSSIVSSNQSSISTLQTSINNINSNLSNINVWKLHSTVKTDVPCGAGYCAYLVLGFQQYVGAVSFSLIVNGSNVVVNNFNGMSVDFLKFEYRNDVLYIHPSDSNYPYMFTVVGCSASG